MSENFKFSVGDSAEMTVSVTDELVQRFAEFSGDRNPLHLDADYAGTTRFHRRVCPWHVLWRVVFSVDRDGIAGARRALGFAKFPLCETSVHWR